jgi:carbonic anhydrase/acetyltransferase-like protein (isoleucine patch superfamily)
MPPVGASDLWAQQAPARAPGDDEDPVPPVYETSPLRSNVWADFNPDIEAPTVHPEAYVDPKASVIGNVELSRRVYVAPFVSVRGDEGQPLYVGEESNLQDGVVIHALTTTAQGKRVPGNTYEVDGKRYAVYIGDRVSLAHQSQVHGPAYIEDDVFVGMQAMVFRAHIGAGTVVEPDATVIGVHVPPGRYVPAGSSITGQATADRLPNITESYALRDLNPAVVHVHTSLAEGYSGESRPAHPQDH